MFRAVYRIRRIEPKLAIYISSTHLRVRHRAGNHIDPHSKVSQQLTSTPGPHKIARAKYQRGGRGHQLFVFEDCLTSVASNYTVTKLDQYSVGFVLGELRNDA